jgi:hypothetical protein
MAAEIVNINGVGRNEVIKDSALGSPQSVKISYNTDGDTPLEVSDEPYSASPYYVSTGDLNNDGKLDMVVTDDSDDRYLLNTGNGAPPLNLAQFGANLLFQFADGSGDEGFGSQSLIVDLNNDGWKDVLIANVDVDTGPNCSDRLRIYHNLGNAPNVTLKEEAQTNTSSGWKGAVGLINSDLAGTYHTAVFDLDGDGDQDLMIGRCAGNFVWINQLNPCPSVTYGTVNNNSTGQPARISIYGSGSLQGTLPPEAPEPHLIFNVRNLPPNAVGHLVYSPQAKTPCVAYGDGQLCILRRARQLHELPAVQADASGRARVVLDFAAEPFASAVAGQHWYFQFVYADSGPAGFNLSEAVNVQVCQ